MYWVEICNDGSYVVNETEYPLLAEGITQLESVDSERSDNDWALTTIPFEIVTQHGSFVWEVEIINYLERGVTSLICQGLSEYPDGVFLKEEVIFRIQDGWEYPNEPVTDLTSAKMRLV